MHQEASLSNLEASNSRCQRLRSELKELVTCFSLRGKISLHTSNLPQQIEVFLYLPETTSLFSQVKKVDLRFMFGEGYPEEAPALFLTSDLLPQKDSFVNIINEEKWNPSKTLLQVIKELMKIGNAVGLEKALNNIFNSNDNIQSSHRHNKEQNNINKQLSEKQNSFASPFSCFKPILLHIQPSQNKQVYFPSSPTKYQKKEMDGVKFSEISQRKSSQNSKNAEKERKKQAKPMNKNANLPKFLIRIFIKYVDRFKERYEKKQYDKLQIECRKMKDWKRHDRKQHAFGLKHLKRFFQDEEDGYPPPTLNREIITSIIQNFLLQQICENSQIPQNHRVGYLVACRVYSLRCRNAILAGRIQSK